MSGRLASLLLWGLTVSVLTIVHGSLSPLKTVGFSAVVGLVSGTLDLLYPPPSHEFLSLGSVLGLALLLASGLKAAFLAMAVEAVFKALWGFFTGCRVLSPLWSLRLVIIFPVAMVFTWLGGGVRYPSGHDALVPSVGAVLVGGVVATLIQMLVGRSKAGQSTRAKAHAFSRRTVSENAFWYSSLMAKAAVVAFLMSLDQAIGLLAGVFFVVFASHYLAQTTRAEIVRCGILRLLMSIVESRDSYTRGHSERVAHLALAIAEQYGLAPCRMEDLFEAALLHDLGKITVPDYIVLKAGKLTPHEFDVVKRHPRDGAELVAEFDPGETIVRAIEHHHERFDGNGYPAGLSGRDVPLLSRIIAVADTFDAMTSRRTYRAALTKEQAIEEIRNQAGTQFDPAVADAAVCVLARMDTGEAKSVSKRQESRASPPPIVTQLRRSLTIRACSDQGTVYWYREGSLTIVSGDVLEPALEESLTGLCSASSGFRHTTRQYVVTPSDHVYDIRIFPSRADLLVVYALEITPMLRAEQDEARRAYGQAMSAVTRGRLRLVTSDTIASLVEGECVLKVEIREPSDISVAREQVTEALKLLELPHRVMRHLILAVSEAGTNALKHAHSGTLSVFVDEAGVRVLVSDAGPGIGLDELPRALLETGYSTSNTLGRGFEVMLRSVDRVFVATSQEGTTVVLEIYFTPGMRARCETDRSTTDGSA